MKQWKCCGIIEALLALVLCASAYAQTPVPIFQSGTLVDYYLFNESWQVDDQRYWSLPYYFYYANTGTQPPIGSRRTRCVLTTVAGAPYGHADIDWFNYPDYSAADGQYPYAGPGEYMASAQFGPNGYGSPYGFEFLGEFAGSVTSATPSSPYSYYAQAVYFTDRRCSDAGAEYGWFRVPANSAGDQAVDSVTFYYSVFTNCAIDFMCWDTNGQQVYQPTTTATITGIPLNSQSARLYRFRAIESGSNYVISLIDPVTSAVPSGCTVVIQMAGEAPGAPQTGNCQFSVPIAAWYPTSATRSGYIVAASQARRTYPPPVGSPQGTGGVAPTNFPGLSGLDARAVNVLYQ